MKTDLASVPESQAATRAGFAANKFLLLFLFFVLYFADTLNLNLSLAPGLSVKNVFLYLILLSFVIETAVTRQRRVELVSVFGPFTLFVAYAVFMWLVALFVLDYPGYPLRASLFTLKGGPLDDLIVSLVFAFGVASARQAIWVLRGMIWIVVLGNLITVVEGMGILNFGLIGAKEDGRVVGPVGNANQYGYILAAYIPMAIALFRCESGLKKKLAGVGVVVSLLAFFMAVSRGSIVGLIVGAVIGVFLLRRIIPPAIAIRVGTGLVLLGVVVLVAASFGGYLDLLIGRFEQFGEGRQRASSGRLIFWATLLNRMLEDPISFVTGFGWYAYQTFQTFNVFGHSPHSTYLSILFNLGAVGLLFYIATLVNVLRVAVAGTIKSPAESSPWLIGFVFGFTALAVSLTFNDLVSAAIYIWSLVGICLRIAADALTEGTPTPNLPRSARLSGQMLRK